VADFSGPLDLPVLDGIVAANALHFEQDRIALLSHWCSYLRQAGRLILVEYDTDDGNRWVPYPVSFASLSGAARVSGFTSPRLLARRPSRFLGSIYAALLTPLDAALPSPESRR
jgi:hypothetical protein